ncbi:MAG: homoserine O-acetyltransferase MetX [Bacillota bacterium]
MSISSNHSDKIDDGGVGLVEEENLTLFDQDNKMQLESGAKLGPIDVTYETYGQLNAARDNVILICHHLTASAHAAGWYSSKDKKPGFWNELIGPDRAIDTNQYYVICTNVLGSCYGTTGPASINPATGKEYGLDFPVITIGDMVNLQKAVLDELQINRLAAVIGGSLGGMQVLKWAVEYPEYIDKIVPIGTAGRLKAQTIAYNQVAMEAVKNDPAWQNGNYYNSNSKPKDGMALARKIGIITFRSPKSFQTRFGRKRKKKSLEYSLGNQFEINSYLNYQGQKFVNRFDANSFLYLSKAMDLYNISKDYKSFIDALERIKSEVLLITINSDQLFPPQESEEIITGLREVGGVVKHHQLDSIIGHDAFLVEFDQLKEPIKKFLT